MDSFAIREAFLGFFEEREHRRYESVPLIPNDPSIMLTIAGMVPFKAYFMGDAAPPVPRATSYQKCVRTSDIDNVGRTTRHLSFFEMLGNFSFGDYFKAEAIRWAWELSTGPLGLDPERVWVTIYEQDPESADLWERETDVPRARIQSMGADENWWSTGSAGPCGPNTELHYDRGPEWGVEGGPAVNGERYLEFYNLVFMQYERDAAGNVLGELPQQNVDTGMGLERMAVLEQDVPNVFHTDILRPMLDRAVELTGVEYGRDEEQDVSLRVVAEHARTSTFLIADGVLPSKEGRGYILRRLLRRAVRHGQLLGADDGMMRAMVDTVIDTMAPGYPDLHRQRELVSRVAVAEEQDFRQRLRQGMTILGDAIDEARAAQTDRLPGATAFKLHDTYGFPIDLTAEIAQAEGLAVDRDEFERLMDEQRQRARSAAKRGSDGVPADIYREAAGVTGPTQFLGYDRLRAEAELGAIVLPDGLVDGAQEGDEVEVVLPRTPFYAEAGGQVGDRGTLATPTGRLEVLDTQEAIEGLTVHRARVVAGEVRTGQGVEAEVDVDRRVATARSHSATHVLHATVKELLGDHAQQAGSLVEPGRLRFDFPHFEQVSRDALTELEGRVNERVLADPEVVTDVMALDEAKRAGAVANFGDKYGDIVRVVTIGDFSKELCGGTHVHTGANIGTVHIVREESIGANTRRLEALTGVEAYRHASRERLLAEEVARVLDTRPDEIVERVEQLVRRVRDAERELERLRSAGLSQQARQLAETAPREDGLAVVTRRVDVAGMDELRRLALEVCGHLAERGVVVLGARSEDGKAQLVGVVTQDLVDAGVEARPVVQPAAEVVGGGAGGKGELAQAGGREGDRLDEALEVAAREARQVARP